MKAYALLGGPKSQWPKDIKQRFEMAKKNEDLIIGVDRGNLLLDELQVTPNLAVGDYDSLSKSELLEIQRKIPDIRFSNPVKDLTDSELMLQYAFKDYHVDELKIFGATGGRLDHFLVNLLMAADQPIRKFADRLTLVDCQNVIKYYLPGNNRIEKIAGFPYFGVINIEPIEDLNIQGAKYQLVNYSSFVPRIFSSNEFLHNSDYFNLKFTTGLACVIFSKDINRFQHI